MTRDDGSRNPTTAGRRRSGKGKRTKGVGRTGARFPAFHDEEPDDTTATTDTPRPGETPDAHVSSGHVPSDYASSADVRAASRHGSLDRTSSGLVPRGYALPDHTTPGYASSEHGALGDGSAAGADVAPGDGEDDAEFVGRTGARFGPYSVRRPKRAKESDSGSTPGVENPVVETPLGEPTPEQSAERTMPLIKPWESALVRPYAHTGGRTRSSHPLDIEALVSSSWQPDLGDAVLTTHHRRMIVDLCARPRSVAEVAALLSVPLGVARVLLGDLATAGVVVVHPTAGTSGDGEPDLAFMRRVLVGLRRL
ncbi:DUF742 domain-containing protein [Actinophytocola sp. NPDC049390]|uniref:DUF742 domain-containing protein n=1 Tax=Actinophytocola sp. NPDC049390 TaxID=3363894 RepID=UPI0037B2375C